MRAISTCWLLLIVASCPAQFPIDHSVTGDTVLVEVSPARPFASFPFGSGLMVPSSATRMLLLSAEGDVESDAPLSSLHLSTFGTTTAPSGAVMCGKTSAQNAFAGLVNGNGDGFAWIDSLVLGNQTYFSGASAMDNGDLVLFGTSYVSGTDLRPIVRRLTATGTLLWSHHPFTAQITRATHGRELANGDILFTGLDGPPFAPEIKILCGRFSASGDLLGMNRFGNGGFQQGEVVLPAVDGGSIIWGHQDSPTNLVVAKVDDACQVEWYRYFAGFQFEDACVDNASTGYMATGRYTNGGALVARFNAEGDTVWTRSYGGSGARGQHIRPDGFGGYFITGWSNDESTGNEDAPYFLRIDADGSMTEINALNHHRSKPIVRPNPALDAWYLDRVGSDLAGADWRLFNTQGQLMREGVLKGTGPFRHARGTLPAGIHLFVITSPSGVVHRLPIMLE